MLSCVSSTSVISRLHASFWPLSSSFPWYVHIYHSSQYVLLFHPHRMAVPLQSFFCNFLGSLHHSCCPSNVFILDFIPSCHSAHPSQHPHLIFFLWCFLSPRCCPGIRTIQQSWFDHILVNLSFNLSRQRHRY